MDGLPRDIWQDILTEYVNGECAGRELRLVCRAWCTMIPRCLPVAKGVCKRHQPLLAQLLLNLRQAATETGGGGSACFFFHPRVRYPAWIQDLQRLKRQKSCSLHYIGGTCCSGKGIKVSLSW